MAFFDEDTKIRAVTLRERLPAWGRCSNDIAKNNSILYFDIPGLAVQLEALAVYAFDGYIGYTSGATPGIRFTITAPEGASGSWGFMPLAETGPAGAVEALSKRFNQVPPDEQGAGGSAGGLFCIPQGVVATSLRPGLLAVRFTQLTSAASATIVETGSWIRATRIG